MRLDFAASVDDSGVLRPDDPLAWRAGVSRFRGKRIVLSLEAERHVRSSQANRWMWSCLLPLVAEVLSAGRPLPLSVDQAHFVCKLAFLGHEDTSLGPIPKSTRNLSSKEFSDYCSRISAWLATEHGVVVPEIGERVEVEL